MLKIVASETARAIVRLIKPKRSQKNAFGPLTLVAESLRKCGRDTVERVS